MGDYIFHALWDAIPPGESHARIIVFKAPAASYAKKAALQIMNLNPAEARLISAVTIETTPEMAEQLIGLGFEKYKVTE